MKYVILMSCFVGVFSDIECANNLSVNIEGSEKYQQTKTIVCPNIKETRKKLQKSGFFQDSNAIQGIRLEKEFDQVASKTSADDPSSGANNE